MITANTQPVAPASFDERLKVVRERVIYLTRETPPCQLNHHRARLWVRWINRQLLADEQASEVRA